MFTLKQSTVLVVGLATMAVCATTALAQTADVQVIHNSPDPAAAEVDIYINDEPALDEFACRSATPVIQLPAEAELVIGVASGSSAGPQDIIATFPVTLMNGQLCCHAGWRPRWEFTG